MCYFVFILPANFLWIFDLAESIYSSLLVWWILETFILWYYRVGVPCRFVLFVFQLKFIFKMDKVKRRFDILAQSTAVMKMKAPADWLSSWNWMWIAVSSPYAGAEVRSGVEQPVSHEAKTASTQWSPLPQSHFWLAAAGCLPAPSLKHQEVRL